MEPNSIVRSMNNYVNLIRTRIRDINSSYVIPPIGYIDGNKFFSNNFNMERRFFGPNTMRQFIQNLDFIGINMHPIYFDLFDPSINGNAIKWWDTNEHNFDNCVKSIRSIKPTMDIMIAEVGWPTDGLMYGSHRFRIHQQRTYINTTISWLKRRNIKFYWHSMFNNKAQIDGLYSQSWGIFKSDYNKVTNLWDLSPKYNISSLKKNIRVNFNTNQFTYL